MADYNSYVTALPGPNRYPGAHNGTEFSTALPRTGNYPSTALPSAGNYSATALPKPKNASPSKNKGKSTKKALSQGHNGYSEPGMATALPLSTGGSYQALGQGGQSLNPSDHPLVSRETQSPADQASGGHSFTALPKPRGKVNGATVPGRHENTGFPATALPKSKKQANDIKFKAPQNGDPANFLPKSSGNPIEAVRATGSPISGSPRLVRRADSSSTHIQHIARTIYNTFWGQGLTFHPFTHGDTPIPFSSLWPDRRSTLLDAFKGAELSINPYELCKLLLATNSYATLDALLEEKMLPMDRSLAGGCGEGGGNGHTLAHMACVLGLSEVVQSIMKWGGAKQQPIWNAKDEDDHTPEEVCFKPELRRIVPEKPMFGRKKVPQGQLLKPAQKKLIFDLAASPNDFYRLVLMLQMYVFDVNNERNDEGDLLIHIAIRGGLPQLPLLFVLVNVFKADLYQKDGCGATPLTLAIEMGDEALVEVCVCVFGMEVNRSFSSSSATPLHMAITASQPRIVSILLRRGADPCSEDSEGRDPIFLAKKLKAYESRQIITQFLKERIERLYQDTITGRLEVNKLFQSDLHAVCSNGCTLLMVASMYGQDDIVRQLLKKEVPIDFKQMKTSDPLDSLSDSFEASWCESHNTRDHTLKTAVHLAAEKGNRTCLQLLLECNAHPSMMDSCGMVPLHYAVDKGHIECVKLILNYPNSSLGLTALKPAIDLARENKFPEILDLLEKARERRQKDLVSPLLFEIARSGNDEHILHIFENGDDANPLDDLQDWPLLVAARCGHCNVVMQLHQFGGHIAQRHRKSRTTPLHEAAREGRTSVVKYLLQFCHKFQVPSLDGEGVFLLPSGALEDDQCVDINGRNAVGCTPLELAAGQGHTDIVRLLLEHKASTSLPDSTGRLVSCVAFAGTQFLIESHRKAHLQTLLTAIIKNISLDQFRQYWRGPSDFNLIKENGDSILLIAAASARLDVLRFLLEEAAVTKPASLVAARSDTDLNRTSSDDSPAFGHSRCLSDSQTMAAYAQQNNITRSLHLSPEDVEEQRRRLEEDEPAGRKTALPSVFTSPGRGDDHRRRRQRRGNMAATAEVPPPKPPRGARIQAGGNPFSSEEEEEVGLREHDNLAAASSPHLDSDTEGEDQTDIFTNLVRYTNPRDGQSMLHRAALNCRHDNIKFLLESDRGLANIQDRQGNTALHLACTKAVTKPGRLTVQALLDCEHVLTLLRNKHGDLPEHKCMKAATRRLLVKTRQARNEQETSPHVNEEAGVLVPVEAMENNGTLNDIQEGVTSEPYMSDLTTRMQQMKMDRQERLANQRAEEEQEGGATTPT